MRPLVLALTGALGFVAACSSSGDLPLGPFAEFVDAGASSASGSGVGSFVASSGANTVVIVTNSTTSAGASTTGSTSAAATTTTAETSTGTETSASTTASTTSSTSTSSSSSTPSAPTWSFLYTTYLAEGSTIGDCDGSCHHHSECDGPKDCFAWIADDLSRLSWEGGDMPPDGPSASGAAQAVTDFAAWKAAGALDN